MGGIHPSVMPYESLAHADSIVIGEAEGIWRELIEDIRSERLSISTIQKTILIFQISLHPDGISLIKKGILPPRHFRYRGDVLMVVHFVHLVHPHSFLA